MDQRQDAAEPAGESQDDGGVSEIKEITLVIQVDAEDVNEKIAENEEKMKKIAEKIAENEKVMLKILSKDADFLRWAYKCQ